MQITNHLHTQPTKLRAAHRAHHMIATAVVHLDDQHLTPRTRLDLVAVLRVLADAARRHPNRTVTRGARCVARLIRMPFGLAVIAKVDVASGTLAFDARTRRTAGGYDGVAAVGRRAPP